MTTFKSVFDTCIEQLTAKGIPRPKEEALTLCATTLDIRPEILLASPHIEVDAATRQRIEQVMDQRTKRIPLPRIFGEMLFYDMNLKVGDGVFRPYPESEPFIEHVVVAMRDKSDPMRILDLGTGSGCLLLALLKELPLASGVGVDINGVALDLAKQNAAANGLAERAVFQQGSWVEGITELFDLVVANPPRVATQDIRHLQPEMRDYDPHHALDGGVDGLKCFREIIQAFPAITKSRALGAFQVGPKYAAAVRRLLNKAGFIDATIKHSFVHDPVGVFVTNEIQKPWWQRLGRKQRI